MSVLGQIEARSREKFGIRCQFARGAAEQVIRTVLVRKSEPRNVEKVPACSWTRSQTIYAMHVHTVLLSLSKLGPQNCQT